MSRKTLPCHPASLLLLGCAWLACCAPAFGLEPRQPSGALEAREFFLPELYISSSNAPVGDVLAQLPNRAAWERFLKGRGAGESARAYIDPRSGAATNVIGPFPLFPGEATLGRGSGAAGARGVAEAAWRFVDSHKALLGVDTAQLGPVRAVQVDDELWQVSIPQQVGGVRVRDARVVLTVKHGDVVVAGTETWGPATLRTRPTLSAEEALEAGFAHADGRSIADAVLKQPELEIVPFAPREFQSGEAFAGPVGRGYGHRLVWSFVFRRAPEDNTWEVLVDAHTGEVIAFQDKNHYVNRTIKGGVYPLTSTELCAAPANPATQCGAMQSGWPMPFADTGFAAPNNFTNSGGVYNYTSGTATTRLNGQYVSISDRCGTIRERSSTGDIDLGGTNGQHDCTIPAGHSRGDTASSRSCFYEVNKIAELARGWLPTNAWLNSKLTANVNINNTCNAFWNGVSINFYRSGGGCRNTGEMAGVFDHEWGHGLDANDAGGALSNTSEGYADIAAIYRLQTSCVGHGFFWTINSGCGMTADGTGFNADEDQTAGLHCDLDCSGVRDADWDKHADHTPDTAVNFVCPRCNAGTGPCGRQVHCSAAPIRQAAWDLAARDLQAAPFGYDSQTAFIIGNKLFYTGSGNIGQWYACNCAGSGSSDGCAAASGYMQWLVADDDNNNLADGTPHMTAIHAAYNRHGIACASPAPQNSGCGGGPSGTATLTAAAGSYSAALSWTAVAGATRYWVFRTEGHAGAGCNFGKARIAEVASPTLTYTDTQVLAGRQYHYNVVAAGGSSACFGPASNCATVTPTP